MRQPDPAQPCAPTSGASLGTFLAVCLGVAFLAGHPRARRHAARRTSTACSPTRRRHRRRRPQRRPSIDGERRDGPGGSIDADARRPRSRSVDGVAAAEPDSRGLRPARSAADGETHRRQRPADARRQLDRRRRAQPVPARRGPGSRGRRTRSSSTGRRRGRRPAVGDTTTVQTPEPVDVDVVGIATFGDEDGLGPITFTAFTLEGAQEHLARRPGRGQRASWCRRADGVSQDELRGPTCRRPARRTSRRSPAGAGRGERPTTSTADFLDCLHARSCSSSPASPCWSRRSASTTPSRSSWPSGRREAALLRALGASRRQVLGSMVLEAARWSGVVASVVGLVGRHRHRRGAQGACSTAFGFALPAGGLVLSASSRDRRRSLVGVVVTAGRRRRAGHPGVAGAAAGRPARRRPSTAADASSPRAVIGTAVALGGRRGARASPSALSVTAGWRSPASGALSWSPASSRSGRPSPGRSARCWVAPVARLRGRHRLAGPAQRHAQPPAHLGHRRRADDRRRRGHACSRCSPPR